MLIGCFLWQITSVHFDEVGLWWCWEWSTVELPDPHWSPPPITTPKRSAAPSRRLMKGLGWIWPGSGLGGGHSPKQRLICRCCVPQHTLRNPYNLSPRVPHHQLSSGNCKESSSGCVHEMIHFITEVGKVFTTDYILILLAFFMVEGTQMWQE